MKNDYLLKLVIIGDSSVGKTNILMRYCQNTFKPNYTATIGVDFKVKSIQVGDTRIKIQIWDTAGQERYRNITQAYYKGAAGIFLTYSVADEQSFKGIEKWMKQVNDSSSANVIKLIVGNKSDVQPGEREVQTLDGRALADRYQVPFMEVSAKTGHNIQQLFALMAEKLVKQYLPSLEKQETRMLLRNQKQHEKASKKQKCQC